MGLPAHLQRWKVFGSLFAIRKSPSVSTTPYAPLSSSASDTDSLLENGSEKGYFTDPHAQGSNWRFRVVVTFIIALLNISFLLSIWSHQPRDRPFDVSDKLFPQPEYETIIFHEDHIEPGPETDKVWEDDLPHGHGFTVIDDPDALDLPRGVAYADGFKKYGVSWAHQYHCVWMLRTAFWDLVNDNSTLVNVDINEKSKEGGDLWHLAHCFDYLRQHILCNMDMTLEWPTLEGSNKGLINGYEIPHQCKKRQRYDEYMDLHAPDPALLIHQKLPGLPSHAELGQDVDGKQD